MADSQNAPVTIVLGGTGAIGGELAQILDEQRHHVVLAGRNRDRLAALETGQGFETCVVDAAIPGSVEACIAEVAERQGRVTGIANCIGSILLKPAHLTTDDEFAEVLQTNLGSSFAAIRGAAKAMRNTGGSVVLVSTAAVRIGIPNHEAIAAAKAGVEGLARSAAATYANSGIRVNVVAPGLVTTPLSRNIWENPAAAAASLEMHALGRLGTPRDIASLVAWLLDPQNDWITGQVIGVDGGLGSLRRRPRRTVNE